MAVEKLKWYQDDAGDTSIGRIGFAIGVIVAGLAVILGGGLAVVETLGKYGTANGVAIVGIGAGLMTTAFGFKAWQRQAEAKIATGSGA